MMLIRWLVLKLLLDLVRLVFGDSSMSVVGSGRFLLWVCSIIVVVRLLLVEWLLMMMCFGV